MTIHTKLKVAFPLLHHVLKTENSSHAKQTIPSLNSTLKSLKGHLLHSKFLVSNLDIIIHHYISFTLFKSGMYIDMIPSPYRCSSSSSITNEPHCNRVRRSHDTMHVRLKPCPPDCSTMVSTIVGHMPLLVIANI